MRPIKWDGTARGADRVLLHMPPLTVSWWGAGPGIELFLHDKTGKRQIGKATRGDLIAIKDNGDACVVRSKLTLRRATGRA